MSLPVIYKFFLTVTPVNDVPTIAAVADQDAVLEDSGSHAVSLTGITPGTPANEAAQTVTVTATSSDPALIPNPTISGDQTTLTYAPAANAHGGPVTITVTVQDNGGTANGGVDTITETFTVSVTPVNDVPTIAAVADQDAVLEDSGSHAVSLTGITPGTPANEAAQTVTVTATSSDPAIIPNPTISGDQTTLTYAPAANAHGGPVTITVTVQDNSGTANGGVDTITEAFTVSVTPVNDVPTIAAVADQDAVLEDSGSHTVSLTGITPGTPANEAAQTVTVTATSSDPAIVPNPTISEDKATLTYAPAANAHGGPVTITVTVQDNGGTANGGVDTITETFTVAVTAVNDAPVANDDAVTATAEDTALVLDAATLLGNDTDLDGDTLSISAVSNASNGTVIYDSQTTKVTFTPAADYTGAASFTYTASDGNGGTDTATATFTVTAVNDAPVANEDTSTTAEDTALVLNASTLLGNDTDVENDTLGITSVAGAQHGTVSYDSETKQVTFTPAQDYVGAASFTYTMSDGNGGEDTATVTITVTAVNDAPVATDDTSTTAEDTALVLNAATLLGNDTDVENDTLGIMSVAGAQHGTVSYDSETKQVTFTPAKDYDGAASFTYTVSDGNGGEDTATVTVNVTAVNDAPLATADEAGTTPEDTALVLNATSLLSNDTDVENDTLSITAVAGAQHGTVTYDSQTTKVTFTPAADYTGAASFTYTASDGNGGTDTATVTFTVTAVNDTPLATDDTSTTAEDTALVLNAATLLGNDTDIEDDTLGITAVGNAVHGAVNYDSETKRVTFTPAANYVGAASFTYTVSDGNGGEDTATVTITVTAVNDAPVANEDTSTTAEDTALVLNAATLLGNDTDVENDTLGITSVAGAQHGTVSYDSETKQVTFTPAQDYVGAASFTYTMSDGNGGEDTATVTITVTAVNDAPVAADDTAATVEDTAVVIAATTLLENDTDVDGDTLSIDSVSGATHGTVSYDSGVKEVTFTPTGDYAGSATFTYTMKDGNGGTDTATVTVNVAAVNDAPVAADDIAGTISEDTALVVNAATLLGNDTDVENDILGISAVGNAVNGTVNYDNMTKQVTFTPQTNYTGAASFTYTVSDGEDTDTATVTLNVTSINDRPTIDNIPTQDPIADDSGAHTITLTGITAGADNESTQALTVTAVSSDPTVMANPIISAVVDGQATLTYAPARELTNNATVTITVTVQDDGGTDNGGVNTISKSTEITITHINHQPTISAVNNQTVDENTTLGPIDVTIGDYETDADLLTFEATENDPDGVIDIISLGGSGETRTVTIDPVANMSGTASVTLTVKDADNGQASVTFNVTVNSAPTISPIPAQSTRMNVTISNIPIILEDNDVDSLVLTTSVKNDTNGVVDSVTIDGTGSVRTMTIVPTLNKAGAATITVTAKDKFGIETSRDVSLKVIQTYRITCEVISLDANGNIIPPSTEIGGTVSPAGTVIVTEHGYSFYTATPNTGSLYGIQEWVLDDGAQTQTGGNTFDLSNITADHTLKVYFKKGHPAPTVTAINSTSYENAGRVAATITGTNFRTGAKVNLVWPNAVDGQPDITASDVVVKDTTTIECFFNFTKNAIGDWTLVVRNDDGQSANFSSPVTLTPATPHLTKVTPAVGKRNSTVFDVELIGYGFAPGATVALKSGESTVNFRANTTFCDTSRLLATVDLPDGMETGNWMVVVENPDHLTSPESDVFFTVGTADSPVIANIVPISAQKASNGTGIASFQINGDNFYIGAGDVKPSVVLHLAGQTDIVADVTSVSKTQLACTFDMAGQPEGKWDVTVTNPDGQSVALAGGFSILPAGLSAVSLQIDRRDPQPYGCTLTLKATKIGSATDVQYAFFAKYKTISDGQWVIIPIANYSSKDIVTWKPPTPANYDIYVTARIDSAPTDQVVSPVTFYRIQDGAIETATCTVTNNVAIDGTVKLQASTTGNAVNVEYKFAALKIDQATGKYQFLDLREYSIANTFDWTPTSNGIYSIGVFTRVIGSGAPYQIQSPFKRYTITGVK